MHVQRPQAVNLKCGSNAIHWGSGKYDYATTTLQQEFRYSRKKKEFWYLTAIMCDLWPCWYGANSLLFVFQLFYLLTHDTSIYLEIIFLLARNWRLQFCSLDSLSSYIVAKMYFYLMCVYSYVVVFKIDVEFVSRCNTRACMFSSIRWKEGHELSLYFIGNKKILIFFYHQHHLQNAYLTTCMYSLPHTYFDIQLWPSFWPTMC
jgi:hypothetical protein